MAWGCGAADFGLKTSRHQTQKQQKLLRSPGLEPGYFAGSPPGGGWKANILPLDYERACSVAPRQLWFICSATVLFARF